MWPGCWPFSFEVMVTEGDILFQCGIVRAGVGCGILQSITVCLVSTILGSV